jgi:hypothetical protein
MMSLCSTCGTVVRVVGDMSEIDYLVGESSTFWPNGYICPVCGGAAIGVPADRQTVEMLMGRPGETLFELTPTDAFALHSGLGLPAERKCSMHEIERVLVGGVVRWGLESDARNGRAYIKWLENQRGTRLYLGAGPGGAIVFRIRPKQKFDTHVDGGGDDR